MNLEEDTTGRLRLVRMIFFLSVPQVMNRRLNWTENEPTKGKIHNANKQNEVLNYLELHKLHVRV